MKGNVMTRCLTLLTLSFLATTTLVEAGKNFDFMIDCKDSEKLQAKSKKLIQSIEFAQDKSPELMQALEQKLDIITTRCVQKPLPELSNQEAEGWFEAQEIVSQEKSKFLEKKKAIFIDDLSKKEKIDTKKYIKKIQKKTHEIQQLNITAAMLTGRYDELIERLQNVRRDVEVDREIQQLKITIVMLTGRYNELIERLQNVHRDVEVDRESQEDIDEILSVMRELDRVISVTATFLKLEPKVLKLLTADKTLGDMPGLPPHTSTTFALSPFGSVITPASNVQFPLFPFALGGGVPQVINQEHNGPDLNVLLASLRVKNPQEPMQVDEAPRTFRTTGTNKNAKSKHSAISIKLPNQQMQDKAYVLIVNHRTTGKGPVVRIHDPIQGYIGLGTLPSCVDFCDTIFDISPWAQAIRHAPSDTSVVATYLSFMGDPSDIHSVTIQSGGRTLKEVILGDSISEKQAGIHVYGPENNEDANEWSKAKKDDVQQ